MFLSYLKGSVQSAQVGSTFSRKQNLLFGVPQDSVLVPALFTIYTTPLGRIIQRHGLKYHLYTDNTQLYMSFKPSDVVSKCDAISGISHIDLLQCCQNNAARTISKRRKFDHISPVLRELHWLSVEHRISYEILLLTYKALNGHVHNISQHWHQNMYHRWSINTSLIHQVGGLKLLESELSPRQPRPFGTLYPSA